MKISLTQIVFLIILLIFVVGCTDNAVLNADEVPEGAELPPPPAGADAALAGQGYSTGNFDRNYQFYSGIDAEGMIPYLYLVENGNWVYLQFDPYRQIGGVVTHNDLQLRNLQRQFPNGVGTRMAIDSPCADYEVEIDGSGNYYITRAGEQSQLNVPLNRYNAVLNRRIGNSEDAISIHTSSSGVGWFTLHCDAAGATAEPVCGNSIAEEGEQCDDGNTETERCTYEQQSCTICNAQCQSVPGVASYCGDRNIDRTNNELCDDGNDNPGDGCSADCRQIETGWSCSGQISSTCTEICGDGRVIGNEACDDGNTANGDGCDEACRVENLCGNGRIDPGEQCDGADLDRYECLSFIPRSIGNLRCSSICSFDTRECGLTQEERSRGEQNTLVIIGHFGTPYATNGLRENIEQSVNVLTDYISTASYQRTSINAVIAGPYRISNQGCNLNDGDANQFLLMERGIAAAVQDPTIGNLERFNRIIFMIAEEDENYRLACLSPDTGGNKIKNGIHTSTRQRVFNGNLNAAVAIVRAPSNRVNSVTGTLLHEFAHGLRGRHVYNLFCTDGNGNRVPFSNRQNCRGNDYYGRPQTDVLGHRVGPVAFGHFATPNLELMRWLDEQNEAIITNKGDYTLTPLHISGGLKLLKIPTPFQGHYYLEFRQPVGYDADLRGSPSLNGVFLYVSDLSILGLSFLDPPPYPNPNEFEISSIPLNQPVELPTLGGTVTVTVTSTSPTGAQISIRKS